MRRLIRPLFIFVLAMGPASPVVLGQKMGQATDTRVPVQPADANRSLAFTHVTVIDVAASDARRALKPDQTVVITGQYISGLGKTGTVPIPKAAQVIDSTGKFLLPGFWDMHVHIFGSNWNTTAALNLFMANGVTGIRDMNSDLQRVLALQKQIASGSLLGPRMVVAGSSIYGLVGSGDARRYISAEEARGEVRRLKRAGADFIKVYSFLSSEAFFAVMDEAKKQGLVVAGHVPFAVRTSDAARAGLKSIEHLDGVTIDSTDLERVFHEEISVRIREGKKGILVSQIATDQTERYRDSFNARKLHKLNSVFLQYGTWQCPTLVVPELVARQRDPLRTGVTSVPYLQLCFSGSAKRLAPSNIGNTIA